MPPQASPKLLGGRDESLSIDHFVLQDGRTYRTQESHERLQRVCQVLGNPDLAERVFSENHAASIKGQGKEWLEADPRQPSC